MGKEIPDKNLFMMCKNLNTNALAELPYGYHVRTCRRKSKQFGIYQLYRYGNHIQD